MESNKSHIFNGLQDITGQEGTQDPETPLEPTFLKRQGSSDLPGPLSDFERRYAKEPQLKSVVSHINEVEKKIEQAMAPREKLQRLIQRMFTGNKEIYFTDRSINVETDDKTNIGLQSLSSGEKQLLRICVEALLTGESSIMIDEPEISMHIDWQRQLAAVMRQLNPNAQLILAIHSPEIMANIDDEKVFRL
jgi:predicted ATP-dependent endonuclease of OLD family